MDFVPWLYETKYQNFLVRRHGRFEFTIGPTEGEFGKGVGEKNRVKTNFRGGKWIKGFAFKDPYDLIVLQGYVYQ